MTPSGIEPATFQFVAQYLNHCANAVPVSGGYMKILIWDLQDSENVHRVKLSDDSVLSREK